MNRNFPPSAAEAGFDGESEHNMFSLKRLMVLTLVVSWIAGAGRLVAQTLPPQTMSPQTTTANLKSPDPATSDTAKPADTAKPEVIVPAGYIVGDSDVIRVNVWKEPEVSQTVVVRTDGNISLPLINEESKRDDAAADSRHGRGKAEGLSQQSPGHRHRDRDSQQARFHHR
jgi:hypothetical protein